MQATAQKIDLTDTRMMKQPAVSENQIAFIYAEDLWVANLDGSQPKRLTVDEGVESNPYFSPDGKTIAFSAEYDGNVDVYIIAANGGIPKRLTWHPSFDIVRGFSNDGKSVLYISQRSSFTNRYFQLFTVPLSGGMSTQLEIPNAYWATYSPDGKQMAYTPNADAFRQWKHYRGGTHSVLWQYNFNDKSTIQIPQPKGGSNDVNPMWLGSNIYFLSDRNGEFNLYTYNTNTKNTEQLTKFNDFPIQYAALAKDAIVFEQGGYLHSYSIANGSTKKLRLALRPICWSCGSVM
jgi:tricorn protease